MANMMFSSFWVIGSAEADLLTDAVAFLLLLGLRGRRGFSRKKIRSCRNQKT